MKELTQTRENFDLTLDRIKGIKVGLWEQQKVADNQEKANMELEAVIKSLSTTNKPSVKVQPSNIDHNLTKESRMQKDLAELLAYNAYLNQRRKAA